MSDTPEQRPEAAPSEATESEPRSSEPASASADAPSTVRLRRRPRRVYLPWWGLTALGALAGFATAGWIGLVIGGVLGYFAWKLR
jgi:hypothetical protein